MSEARTFIDVRLFVDIDKDKAERFGVDVDTAAAVIDEIVETSNDWSHGVDVTSAEIVGFGLWPEDGVEWYGGAENVPPRKDGENYG